MQITETVGFCKSCGIEDMLGDGLCSYCWDKKRGKNKYSERNKFKEPSEPFEGAGYYLTTVICVDCKSNVLIRVKRGKKPYTKYRCYRCNKERKAKRKENIE